MMEVIVGSLYRLGPEQMTTKLCVSRALRIC
jgi:hypothetical protein